MTFNVLDIVKRWGTKWSLWPVHLVTACCGVELAHTYAPGFDGERLGSLPFGISRQTNLIIVEGTITAKMAKILKVTWEQMPEPKYVIVMGACGIEGGLFWNSYHIVKPWEVVPVVMFVPGCPPTPEALLRGIRQLQELIIHGSSRSSVKPKPVVWEKLTEIKPMPKPQTLPPPPYKKAPKPVIKICPDKEIEWSKGVELKNYLISNLKDYIKNICIQDVNRLAIITEASKLKIVSSKLKELGFDHVKSLNAIDLPHEKKFILEYIVSSFTMKDLSSILISMYVEIPRDNAKVDSLINVWPNIDYFEREIHEMFGIWFEGNPNMGRTFFLDPDLPIKYPLRKDVQIPSPTYLIER